MRHHLRNEHPLKWAEEDANRLSNKKETVEAYEQLESIYKADEVLQEQLGGKEFEVEGHKIQRPKRTRRQSQMLTQSKVT